MDALTVELLNALSVGLLLFLLSAGLTLIHGLMGVLNFAHAGFYMLGAYVGQAVAARVGLVAACVLAPLAVGALGWGFQRQVLARLQGRGHVPELLATFGLGYVILEAVQLVWGRAPLSVVLPGWLQGPAFTLAGGAQFPRTRAFIMALALAVLGLSALAFARTRLGLVVRAARSHPAMLQALGHDVPRVHAAVFAAGCALAALAGVAGGATFVTEPAMAAVMGPIVFVVVVVGGLGSLGGSFVASLLLGALQTWPLAVHATLADAAQALGWAQALPDGPLARLSLAQAAPLMPYALLVGMLAWRPQGLMGPRL